MNPFELFLNRMRGGNMPSVDMPTPQEPKQPDFKVPSQMPGAYKMGPEIDHGIAGNLSDLQKMPYRYGDQTGGIQKMPYRYGTQGPMLAQGQGGFNIMNPFTYGNMKKAVEGTRAGDENIDYSDTPAGKIGEAANERNRMIQQLLQGY